MPKALEYGKIIPVREIGYQSDGIWQNGIKFPNMIKDVTLYQGVLRYKTATLVGLCVREGDGAYPA